MHESHTGLNVNEMFQTVGQEWGLATTDVVLVTDNAASMVAATQLGNLKHFKCFAPIINLTAQTALKLQSVSQLQARIERIREFFQYSATANHALQQKHKLLELPCTTVYF